MNALQWISRRKNKENIPSAQDAIQKLKQTEKMLEKKQDHLETKISQEIQTAKKHAKTNKRVALQALKRKIRLEKQLKQIDGTLSTIEFQRDALENSGMNTEVLKNMSFAAKALKSVHESLDIDDVHNIMDDFQDIKQVADEISLAMSSAGLSEDLDEEELISELKAFEHEADRNRAHQLGARGKGIPLPTVPSTAWPSKKTLKEKDDLKELEARVS